MSVKFNVVERGDPRDLTAPKKFYPSIMSGGRVTMRQLAATIAQISTVSSTDTMAVLEALLTTIPLEMTKGNIVELGDFGNFWLRSNAEGRAVADDVRAVHIINIKPRFLPGKEFKKVLDGIKFEKA